MQGNPVIFFDGICILCSQSVKLILKLDRKKHYRFCSLQSSFAKKILTENQLKTENTDSIILLEGQKIFIKSEALLKILKNLQYISWTFYLLKLIPKSILDHIYDKLAKHRYKIFGKNNKCLLPTSANRHLFIE